MKYILYFSVLSVLILTACGNGIDDRIIGRWDYGAYGIKRSPEWFEQPSVKRFEAYIKSADLIMELREDGVGILYAEPDTVLATALYRTVGDSLLYFTDVKGGNMAKSMDGQAFSYRIPKAEHRLDMRAKWMVLDIFWFREGTSRDDRMRRPVYE